MRARGVDGQLFEVLLCQLSPGSEGQALGHVRSFKDAAAFLPFAEFDLAAIVPQTLADVASERHLGLAAGLRDLQRALCFGWAGASWPVKKLRDLGPVVAFTFVKLDEALVRSQGVRAEWAVIRLLEKRRRESRRGAPTVVPYGTFGWPEMLLVIGGADFGVVIDEILALRRLPPTALGEDLRLSPEAKRSPHLFADTHTVPCLRLPPDATTPYDSRAAATTAPIHATVLIATGPGRTGDVHRRVKADLGTALCPMPAFGFYDLVLHPPATGTGVPDLVRLLGFVRHPESCPGVLTTQVILCPPAKGPGEDPAGQVEGAEAESTAAIRRMLETAHRRVSGLARYEEALKNRSLRFSPELAKILMSYSAVRGVRELAGLVDDLDGFLEEMLRRTEAIVDRWGPMATVRQAVREAYEFANEAPRLFKFGFDQRLSGAQIGLANSGRGFTGVWPLGVQRLIGAASAVPRYLLAPPSDPLGVQAPRAWDWHGFLIFGYSAEALCRDLGVMNLPAAALMDPAEWWMLCHEAGHELCAQIDVARTSPFDQCIDVAARREDLFPPGLLAAERMTYAIELVDELVAEAFSFVTMFDADWPFYRRVMWGFLQDHLEGRAHSAKIEEYLIRATYVFFFHLEREGALATGERVSEAILQGRGLRDHLFAVDQDSPAYTPSNDRSLERNLIYRSLGEYASVADIVRREIQVPAGREAHKIAAEVSAASAGEVAKVYEAFEATRSETVRIVSALAPGEASSGGAPEGAVRGALEALLELRHIGNDPSKHWAIPLRADIYKQLSRGGLHLDEGTPPPRLVAALKQARLDGSSGSGDARAVIAGLLSLWHRNLRMPRAQLSAEGPVQEEVACPSHRPAPR